MALEYNAKQYHQASSGLIMSRSWLYSLTIVIGLWFSATACGGTTGRLLSFAVCQTQGDACNLESGKSKWVLARALCGKRWSGLRRLVWMALLSSG